MLYMKNQINPTNKNIKFWVKSLIPSKDVWFFKSKPKFKDVQVLDIKTYLNKFNKLEYNNAYCHWLVKQAKYVIVENSNWILTLEEKERNKVYAQQIELERGLIIENCEQFVNNKVINVCVFDNKIILSNAIFKKLNYKLKKELAVAYAKEQDSWDCLNVVINNKKINKIANKFLNVEGTNCLAIVLYALTLNKKYLNCWVQQGEFEDIIKDFIEIKQSEVDFGDIAVFYDENNTIQHACFALSKNEFLNKSGQSKFNPILILNIKTIKEDWKGLTVKFKRNVNL